MAVAGRATRRSQKIHNQLAGVAAAPAATALFLFLDDDIALHQGSVDVLVRALLADEGALLATGYPFEVPPAAASLPALCLLAYHLPLIVAFSHGAVTRNVWGGCMLLPARHCRPGGCVARVWADGAYSDDLNVAALASARGERVLCPAAAVFPTALPRDVTWPQAWNYMRRQLYVLDTYAGAHNRRINHALLAASVYGAAALLAPLALLLARLPVRRRLLPHPPLTRCRRPARHRLTARRCAASCLRRRAGCWCSPRRCPARRARRGGCTACSTACARSCRRAGARHCQRQPSPGRA